MAAAVRIIKSNSSRWVHATFPEKRQFAWQAGYAAFSIGRSGIDNVRAYIKNQEEHHRSLTFQEEYLEFLRRYEIEFDEHHLWE